MTSGIAHDDQVRVGGVLLVFPGRVKFHQLADGVVDVSDHELEVRLQRHLM